MTHMYFDTFISVAPDFAGTTARIPAPRGSAKTVAQLQYETLIDAPFTHTQEDVLFSVWLRRQEFGDLADDEIATLRVEYFSQGRACLRASPLTKTHGWGVVFNGQGRAALCAIESADYHRHAANPDLEQLAAMRSKRATKAH